MREGISTCKDDREQRAESREREREREREGGREKDCWSNYKHTVGGVGTKMG